MISTAHKIYFVKCVQIKKLKGKRAGQKHHWILQKLNVQEIQGTSYNQVASAVCLPHSHRLNG